MLLPAFRTLEVVDLAGRAIDGAVVVEDDAIVEPIAPGRWRLREDSEIRVTAPTCAARRFKVPWSDAPVRLTLLPESVLSGRVVDARTGEPVAGADVHVSWPSPDLSRVVTDREGRYRINALGPARLLVHAGDARRDGQLAVAVGLGEQVEAPPLRVYERSVLTGTIRAADGQPCARGAIRLNDIDHAFHSHFACADERGDVRLRLPRGHRFALEVECEQHQTIRAGPIEVDSRDIVDRQWRAERGIVMSGRVVDEGLPVPGAMLFARAAERSWTSTVTGADGSFEIGGLVGHEALLEISVMRGGIERTGAHLVPLVAPETRDVTVGLFDSLCESPQGRHEPDRWQRWQAHPRGVVVDAGGAPVAGAIVAYVGGVRPHELWELAEATVAPGLTGPDGRFDFAVDELRERLGDKDRPPMLVALRPGGGVAAAEYTADAPVRLKLAPPGTIVARVRDAAGQRVRRVGMTFAPSHYETLEFFDSDDGIFVQGDLFPGTYDVKVRFRDLEACARVELAAGETRTVDLVLAPTRNDAR